MNCRRRGSPKGGDAEVHGDKTGTKPEMKKGDGTTPSSWDPVERHPYWEDPAKIIDGNK